MQFESPLLRGTLIKRYKRFFADIQLDNGEIITAHCANTGAMTGCAEPGYLVWVSPANNPKRKLQYTWELAQTDDGDMIGVNTNAANKVVEHALESGTIDQLIAFPKIRREYKPEGANSRFDFLVQNEFEQCLVEVKSLTLCENQLGYFPDAVTTRGAKHCRELANYVSDSCRCVLLFCVQHTGVEKVKIAEHIDPDYALAVAEARRRGVEILAYRCSIDQKKIVINQEVIIDF